MRQGAAQDVLNLTSKQNDLNRVEQERLSDAEDRADLDKEAITHSEKLGKLADLITKAGLAGTVAAEQLLSVENDRYNIAVKTLEKKQAQVKADEEAKKTQILFTRALESSDDPESLLDTRQNEAAGALQARFFTRLSPSLKSKLFGGPPTEALTRGTDFSSLASLSGADFSGIKSLDGLTLTVK